MIFKSKASAAFWFHADDVKEAAEKWNKIAAKLKTTITEQLDTDQSVDKATISFVSEPDAVD